MANEYDLVVLGGGTGGYVAAIRASQLGKKVAIVEKGDLGGTCLHRGCIPSKSLLKSAEVFQQMKNAEEFGVSAEGISLDFNKVQERKRSVVEKLYSGVQGLMKKGKIDVYEGHGRILGPSIFSPSAGTISVEMNNGEENVMLIPKNVLLATGSKPKTLPGLHIDGEKVMTSDEALEMEALPASIIIVGGGVIGMEWASMLADFDVEVTVVEFADRILPQEDGDISKEMERLMKRKGITIHKGAKLLPETLKTGENVTVSASTGDKELELQAEKLLVSIGRSANIKDIGLENTDIEVENEVIKTNEMGQTKESHIYAIGDVIGGLQLAHVASHEGMTAVEHMNDLSPASVDHKLVPSCIYSNPEAARVGWTEEEATNAGFQVKIGKFPFQAIGKALVEGESDGFVKIIADQQTDDLLGVHMIGPDVTNLISEAGLAKVLDATPWEIASSIHPHPTLSEALGEAAMAVDGKQIHG
ncbi:dihydrolipoyl dehydrogenase [Salimicrobium flavidum]|uniref:Dihydrolipoyl dehydrogenase n=1 Tax=Salimicrobium flavidum TaxID=570947 RepID=A0A1N7IIT9_9BACI|nr:dihydrolipoyl dehydrogenase [Salimicrobium flavidum]SIS36968.1 dihydrolipoamide dehydrogenase [Salimicrobium flavidum]